jgi:nanoRNase/pAp phosphatase (c-di-AMP/oligoRNAs hydrolase)
MLSPQEQFFRQIDSANRLAIVFNQNWSGDSLATALALKALLAKLGKPADIAGDTAKKSDLFNFLPDFASLQAGLAPAGEFVISLDLTKTKTKDLKYRLNTDKLEIVVTPEHGSFSLADLTGRAGGWPYDAVIMINCAELTEAGSVFQNWSELFYQTPLINIDTQSANDHYGQINLTDTQATSSAEIVWQLFKAETSLIDEDIATLLLAGIISATNNFTVSRLSPQTLAAASELLKLGARREEIIDRLYRQKSLGVLKLWGAGLAGLTLNANQKIAWTVFDYATIKEAKVKRHDLISLIQDLIANLPSVEAVILFIDKGSETTALIYSLGHQDASALSAPWQGIGDKKLAQISINEPVNIAKDLVLSKLNATVSTK